MGTAQDETAGITVKGEKKNIFSYIKHLCRLLNEKSKDFLVLDNPAYPAQKIFQTIKTKDLVRQDLECLLFQGQIFPEHIDRFIDFLSLYTIPLVLRQVYSIENEEEKKKEKDNRGSEKQ